MILAVFFLWHLVVGSLIWLGDVEGYYWLWSRDLELSYLDHPPLDAWLIRASTAVFGDTLLGVRFVPASLTTFSAWIMARAAGAKTLWLMCLMPGFVVLGIAASPDAPVVAAGASVVWLTLRAPSKWNPVWLGALIGLGTMAKLTMLYMGVGVLWAWLSDDRLRAQLRWWNVALGVAAFVLIVSPLVAWNVQHDFAMWRFHSARLRGPSLLNATKLVFGQLGYFSPLLCVLCVRALFARDTLAKLGLPSLLIVGALILCTPDAEPQWTALAYLPAVVLVARGVSRRTIVVSAWLLAVPLALAHVHLLSGALVRLVPESVYRPRVDIANDLRGWSEVATETKQLVEPGMVLGAAHYTLCGQLAFATKDTPKTVCVSGRTDAFDFIPGRDETRAPMLFVADDRFTEFPAGCVHKKHLDVMHGGKRVRFFDFYVCKPAA